MSSAFGSDRHIALCRELTKLNEEIIRITLGEAVEYYSEREPRGEYVLVVAGRDKNAAISSISETMTIREQVEHHIASGMSKNDAIKATAKSRNLTKNEVYQEVIDLKV